MQIHTRAMLNVFETALPFSPPTAVGQHSQLALGAFVAGQELQLEEAWIALQHPQFFPGWHIMPLDGARIILAHQSDLTVSESHLAESWRQIAVGALSALFAPGLPTTEA